jgi:YidC/Oxa1 family membrane protein insertase
VATTFLQSKLVQPPSTGGNDQGAMVNKSMSIYMPVLMGFMAYSLASGLALYFLVSNLFTIGQYAILGRANWSNIFPFLKKKDDDPKAPKPKPVIVEDVKASEPKAEVYKKSSKNSNRPTSMTKKKRPPRKKRN